MDKTCTRTSGRDKGLNQGQRKKLLRNPAIRSMFERYGVEIEE